MRKSFVFLSLTSFLIITFTLLYFNYNTPKGGESGAAVLPAYINNVDTTYSPVNDFYEWAVGAWLKENPVPDSESSWGSFNEVYERNKVIIKSILEETAQGKSPDKSEAQKIGAFYQSGMDSISRNKEGITPLLPVFEKIDRVNDRHQLIEFITWLQSEALSSIYGIYVGQDMKNNTEMIPYMYQAGISLPDRDYYLKEDEESKKIRYEYLKHLENVLNIINENADNKLNAGIILELETKMAEFSMDRVKMRDPYATYHKMSWKELSDIAPAFNWETEYTTTGLPKLDSVIVEQPEYFSGVSELLINEPVDSWKTYLKWVVASYLGDYLDDQLVSEFFHFNKTVLNGQKENKPRWENVMLTIDQNMGMAVGKLYVEKAFKPEAKERVLNMVKTMQLVFKDRIMNLDWMSRATKDKAIVKLDKFQVKIGYPDKWRDYTSLEINSENTYAYNVWNSWKYNYYRKMDKIGKPIDRTEWEMNPHQVNAYYNPLLNEIVFPAAILQPPFFDMSADDAYNYGAIGAVIGHEITHGFDDTGRQFDAEGNLKNWWTSEDSIKFMQKAEKLVNQYNAYTVLDSIHVNGELTLGENIADLGGLTIALDALKRSESYTSEPVHGYNAEQRFFMAWANSWKCNSTDEDKRHRIITDPHSPKKVRGIAPVANMDAFHHAFSTKEGDIMYSSKEQRVAIW